LEKIKLIVQFTKSIIKKKFGDGIVRLYAFIIALVLTFIFANSGTGADEILADPKAEKSK
jgi:hypothetical protein